MSQKRTFFDYRRQEKPAKRTGTTKSGQFTSRLTNLSAVWDISPYRDRWDLIENVLNADRSNASEISSELEAMAANSARRRIVPV
jgi:hypothetical protein